MCGGMAFSSAILLFAVTCIRDEEQVIMRKEKREKMIEEKKKKKEQREKEKGMTTLISGRLLNLYCQIQECKAEQIHFCLPYIRYIKSIVNRFG